MKPFVKSFCILSLFTLLYALLMPSASVAQLAGQNVNMVSGTQWPKGDPFLQRQNEPSMAVSTRNPMHVLAGSNDYRSVDLELVLSGGAETGDSWLGLFKSFDGGLTWQSTLSSPTPSLGFAQSPAPRSLFPWFTCTVILISCRVPIPICGC